MEIICLSFSVKIEEGYGGFFLDSWASSRRKISKIWALWERSIFDIIHLGIQ
jgi:hypothetical protein